MSSKELVKEMIDAGIHFGHRTSNWCPKMKPYIYGKKNGIHIIDVRETVKGLLLARKFLLQTVSSGKDVLFVGTKRQARPAIEEHCNESGMPYVTERWLGGTLTNFRTIRSRLKRLEELETLMASEEWANYSKKMGSQLTRERRKIDRNLGGVRKMNNLPGAVVVVDVKREANALREARKLNIPTIALLDTDSTPEEVDIPIPGNDDAMRSINIIVREMTAAINEGINNRKASREGVEGDDNAAPKKRRSKRAMFSADDAEAPAAAEAEVAAAPPVEEAPAPVEEAAAETAE